MFKKLVIALITFVLAFGTSPVLAGGWSVLTLDELPSQVTAARPVTIGFVIRQHGQHPLGGLEGAVVFDRVGEKRLRFPIHDAGTAGHYTATITLPKAGTWPWRIEAFGEHIMPPLTVLATATSARAARMTPTQLAALGKDLFVAKGCSSCHGHQAVVPSGQFNFAYGAGNAPGLTIPKFDAAYLRVWLKDPKAVKPQTQMPNFDLKANEIEALTAFLTQRAPIAKK